MTIARRKLEAISIIAILIAVSWICSAGAEEASSFALPDWLGAGPIYSYGNYHFPYYYPYYDDSPLIYSPSPAYTGPFWNYAQPYYYSGPYWTLPYSPFAADLKPRNPFKPWWVGAHRDLPRVLDIARSSSSMRVYANGAWQTL
ncbi:MAG: hypothetical protein NTV25_03080 [Methanothrix sp.]|nr:hypothetical protein [Methanothrix sp.]